MLARFHFQVVLSRTSKQGNVAFASAGFVGAEEGAIARLDLLQLGARQGGIAIHELEQFVMQLVRRGVRESASHGLS